ncbi:hypothetical protein BKA65DRAFT_491248 [Rhexocercosporidium sp. MPI-PUGE-AT-0058]|nr:hypothetical protein BKA65DRAFT_491248 [Rhexocercosporidium sp. MPI-PUGE-AT-0058]
MEYTKRVGMKIGRIAWQALALCACHRAFLLFFVFLQAWSWGWRVGGQGPGLWFICCIILASIVAIIRKSSHTHPYMVHRDGRRDEIR